MDLEVLEGEIVAVEDAIKMNKEAIEEMKAEELKESIDELKGNISETEEEIAIEIFVNVVEEKSAKKEEITEKIEKCEKLKREYVEKIERLRQKSSKENSYYEKVKASLSEEIDNLRKMRAKLENKRVNEKLRKMRMMLKNEEKDNKEMEHAALKQEVNVKEKAGATAVAASAEEKAEKKAVVAKRAASKEKTVTKEKAEEKAIAAKRAASKEKNVTKEKAEEKAIAAKRAASKEKTVTKEKAEEKAIAAKRAASEEKAGVIGKEKTEEKARATAVATGAKEKAEEVAAATAKIKDEKEITIVKKKSEEEKINEEARGTDAAKIKVESEADLEVVKKAEEDALAAKIVEEEAENDENHGKEMGGAGSGGVDSCVSGAPPDLNSQDHVAHSFLHAPAEVVEPREIDKDEENIENKLEDEVDKDKNDEKNEQNILDCKLVESQTMELRDLKKKMENMNDKERFAEETKFKDELSIKSGELSEEIDAIEKELKAASLEKDGYYTRNIGKDFEKCVACCDKAMEVSRGKKVAFKLVENEEAKANLKKALAEHRASKSKQMLFEVGKVIVQEERSKDGLHEYNTVESKPKEGIGVRTESVIVHELSSFDKFEHREGAIENTPESIEFCVMDLERGVPYVFVKPREGIGVYKDSGSTHTPSKLFINSRRFLNFDKLLELLETGPQFSGEQRRTSIQLSGGSERGVHGRGVHVERLEIEP